MPTIPATLRTALASVTLGVALLAAPAAAPAADTGRVAIDATGTAHFSFARSDGYRQFALGRSRTTDGTLGAIDYVSPATAGVLYPRVARGPAGSALHFWLSVEPGGVVARVRRRSADGTLGPVQTLSGAGVPLAPEVAVDAQGNAVFVWLRTVDGKFVVEARRRAANGTLSAVKRVSSAAPTYSALNPDVAVDAAGNAVVTWLVSAPTAYVQLRRRAVDGTLTAVQNVTTTSAAAADPHVGVDAAGNAVVAFRRSKDGGLFIQVRRRSAAGTLTEIQDLSSSMSVPVGPQVAVSADDGAVVAWPQPAGDTTHVMARRRPPGGVWNPAQPISPPEHHAASFKVRMDADGDEIYAWMRFVDQTHTYVQIRRRSAAGTLSPIGDLSPVDGHAADLDLGVEPGGGAVATWLSAVGNQQQVFARRRTAAGEIGPIDQISY